ncbi:MAG: DUF1819 family protein [Fimbriimonadaceae bacterium]|nr:DUF1819 family protein [Fimbriimonadaceae bacterium]
MSAAGGTLTHFAQDHEEFPVMADAPRNQRYALSFTSGALLMREAVVAAPLYLREHDWSKVRELIAADNLLQSRTVATRQRRAREVVQRLAVMTDEELELLVDSTTSERGHLLWAAACRRYDLIAEFAEEVLRERFLLMTPALDHSHFDSFLRNKALWHDEVAALKESTVAKLRSNVFRMLIEAGLLSENGNIIPAVLSARVSEMLSARKPSDVRFFPTARGGR